MCPAQGNPTLGFHLAEPTVLLRDDNVPASIISIPIVNTMPCTAVTIGLRQRFASPKASLERPFFCPRDEELRHVELGGEIASLCADHSDPGVVVVVQDSQRVGYLRHHLRAEGVLLRRIVNYDLENTSVCFGANLPHRALLFTHLHSPPASRNPLARVLEGLTLRSFPSSSPDAGKLLANDICVA